jgi:hypothetical protein
MTKLALVPKDTFFELKNPFFALFSLCFIMFKSQKQLKIFGLAQNWLWLQKTRFLNPFHCVFPMFTSQKQLQSVGSAVGLCWTSCWL